MGAQTSSNNTAGSGSATITMGEWGTKRDAGCRTQEEKQSRRRSRSSTSRSLQTWPQATRKHGQHVGAGKSRQMGGTDRRRYNLLIMQLPFEQTHAPPAAASSCQSCSTSHPISSLLHARLSKQVPRAKYRWNVQKKLSNNNYARHNEALMHCQCSLTVT